MTAISSQPYESETEPAHSPGMLEPEYNEPLSDEPDDEEDSDLEDTDDEDAPDTQELPLDDEEAEPYQRWD